MIRSGFFSLLVVITAALSALPLSQNHPPDAVSAPSASPSPTSAAQPFPTPSPAVTIDFTGRLMGYFRLPDKQTLKVSTDSSQNPCPDSTADGSAEAKTFFDGADADQAAAAAGGRKPDQPLHILVGMGDNFSPNYFSRAFLIKDQASQNTKVKAKYKGKLVGKDLWDWDADHHAWLFYNANRDPNDSSTEARRALDAKIARGEGTVGTDNVACFLGRAHYVAVVPGPHDFYFGAERLRQLARFMASLKQAGYEPVQMLAANLAIQTSWADDHKPLPDQMKSKLKFLTRYIGIDANHNVQVQNFTENGSVYPWMRSVKVQIEPPRGDSSWGVDADKFVPVLCQAQDGYPDDFVDHCSVKLNEKPVAPAEKSTEPVQNETVQYELPKETVLEPGKNYAFCFPDLAGHPSDKRKYCSRFSVLKPFFQTPVGGDGKFSPSSCSQIGASVSHGAKYNDPLPYIRMNPLTNGKITNEKTVVIFGVVDPELRARIGGLNFAWRNVRSGKTGKDSFISNDSYKTEVLVTDPAKALEQLQQCFDQENSDLKRSDTIRVLLAQMTPAAAASLTSSLSPHLQFDVVISEADDLLATPNQTVKITRRLPEPGKTDESSPDLSFAPYVAVPPTHSTGHRAVRKRRLAISLEHDEWTFKTSGEYAKVSLVSSPNTGDEFWQAVGNALKRTVDLRDPKSKAAAIQAVTLAAMQQETQADVAMLQGRDFYPNALQDYLDEQCPGSGCPLLDLQEILDRFIWKGDALVARTVTGGVLKKVLEQSKKLDQEEKSPLASFPERQRPLVYVGIHHDDVSDLWMVNDVPLDEGKLYLVAMSDYIALGDTGFPDLAQTPTGGVAEPISRRDDAIRTISGVVCNHMRDGTVAANRITINCSPFIDPQNYYDQVANTGPNDPRQGQTKLAQLSLWSYFHPHDGERLSPGQKKVVKDFRSHDFLANVDQLIQDRSSWMFSLDKAAIGFSGLWHLDDEATIQQQFGGIRDPKVTAKRFHSWDTDVKDQLIRYQPNLDLFISNTLRYSSKFTGNPNGVRTIDQPQDTLAFDGGAYLHPLRKKMLPQLEWLASAHFETQAFTPYSSVNLNALVANGSSSTLTFAPDRSFVILGRTGPHWQDRKSYAEMGVQAGANLDAITAFSFSNPGAALIPPCILQASQSLGKCANNYNKANPLNPITPATKVITDVTTRSRYGLFWNSHTVVPFHPRLSYTMDNTGDFFFNTGGDNSTDLRFRHQLDQAVKFFVFPNLDFEPTYTIFLFENKVDYTFLFQQQFAIKINYAFAWTNARDKKQQFEYQKSPDK